VQQLYVDGQDGIFNGDFTSEYIDGGDVQNWDTLQVDATIPTDTTATAVFETVDEQGTVTDTQVLPLQSGLRNYTLTTDTTSVSRIRFNGTAAAVDQSWEVDTATLFYTATE